MTQVASPSGWKRDRALVLEFYNQRRRNMLGAEPNAGHVALADLEKDFDVVIVTQNIDNLHERAGSTNVLHLHGEIMKARSTMDPSLVYELQVGQDIAEGDKCVQGSQLRPHIVWFGEDVPEFGNAVRIVKTADILIIVGTSLVVYPANTLVDYVNADVPVYLVDPNRPAYDGAVHIRYMVEAGSTGLPKLAAQLREEYC